MLHTLIHSTHLSIFVLLTHVTSSSYNIDSHAAISIVWYILSYKIDIMMHKLSNSTLLTDTYG